MPDALGARDAIDAGINISFPGDTAPALHGKPSPARYRDLSRFMAEFDLVLTYNWGAMDAVGARRLFPKNCPPLIHHEDGFNADEVVKLNWKRNAFRRLMLPAARQLVVVSERLEGIARHVWKQPVGKIVRIPNGIETELYSIPPKSDAIPGFHIEKDDIIVGTLAGLREVKNLPRLVRAVASQPHTVKLVIVGAGPERAAILAEAARLGVSDRIFMPGFLANPAHYVGLFDIFALSSDSEQFPISLVEAMAAGKPVLCTDVGDVMAIVSDGNRPFIIPVSDEAAFANALAGLVSDAGLRKTLGQANQARAVSAYDEAAMIARYTKLYGMDSVDRITLIPV